jgi:hypothetical protein
MRIDVYRAWVDGERRSHCTAPHETVRKWRREWEAAYKGLVASNALYELCSLVAARWEFLGSLATGYAKARSGSEQAYAYAEQFLVPVNPRYRDRNANVLPDIPIYRLLFQMLRNSSLHGYTPAAMLDAQRGETIGWRAAVTSEKAMHLQFDVRSASEPGTGLHVDGETLADELLQSMDAFATYLQTNARTRRNTLPVEDFEKGFVWRLLPFVARDYLVTPWF